jgi:hypothetical protein
MLLAMGRADAERVGSDPTPAGHSVALWVAHELSEQSRRLEISGELAESMRQTAETIRAEHKRTGTALRKTG